MEQKYTPLKENYEIFKKDKLTEVSERPPNPPASNPRLNTNLKQTNINIKIAIDWI